MKSRETLMLTPVLLCLLAAPAFPQDNPATAMANVAPPEASSEVTFDSPAHSPNTFGTSAHEALNLGSYAFSTARATGAVTGTNENGNGYVWATGGSNMYFVASYSIPAGALINYIGLNYCDNNSSASLTLTAYDSYGDNGFSVIGTIVGPNRTGCGYVYNTTAFNYVTGGTSGHDLTLYVFQTGATNGDVKFRGAEVWYKRQVSPAPATASFPRDVPTSHPFFQFIEALAASGVTSGCGTGSYCPDSPVTRGQMAVFLSKALGLHFPN